MIYQLIQPSLHLKGYIKDYLLLDFNFKDQPSVPVKPYPVSPEQGITFYVRGSITAGTENETRVRRPKIVIFGQATQRQNLQPSASFTMFNVLFRPGALAKFLRIPLVEFVHQNIDAELIFGNDIKAVNDNLKNAQSLPDMIDIVERFLEKKIALLKNHHHQSDKIAQYIFDRPQLFDVKKMAADACLSVSQFEKRFVQQMGVPPKFYARICRFYNAYQIKQIKPDLDWLTVAWSAGYFDYQHLVRDFKQFSYTTPKLFMEEMAESPNLKLGLNPPSGYL